MSESPRPLHATRHRHEYRPAKAHSFWWFLFANGGGALAILLPAHILVQGVLGPLHIVPEFQLNADTFSHALANPIIKLYLLVLFSLPMFHVAHRVRYLLMDLGVHTLQREIAWLAYGLAGLISLVAAWLLITTP